MNPFRLVSRLVFALAVGVAFAAAEDFSKWRCYRTLLLDTSPSGANVTGDVANYPVAVALSEQNFDFKQAKPDGSDVRFCGDKDGALLAHSVEHWDAEAKSALLWVKVPMVRGGRADQVVFMHYGNPAAESIADSTAVFDTREGFVGVWHLSDAGTSEADGYKDATANAAHGTGVNLEASARSEGRVGRGLALAHAKTQWVKVENEKRKLFDLTKHVTFSIWAKARDFANKVSVDGKALPGYETMFAKGDIHGASRNLASGAGTSRRLTSWRCAWSRIPRAICAPSGART